MKKITFGITAFSLLLPLFACHADEKSHDAAVAAFSGQIKTDDERSEESLALAQKFNGFIADHDGKIVKLDIWNYYDIDDENLKRDETGFPDPREFYVNDDCETLPFCTGTAYFIDADLKKLDYDPGHTARTIKGYFKVEVAGMGQGSFTVNLKHLPEKDR